MHIQITKSQITSSGILLTEIEVTEKGTKRKAELNEKLSKVLMSIIFDIGEVSSFIRLSDKNENIKTLVKELNLGLL